VGNKVSRDIGGRVGDEANFHEAVGW